MFRSEEGARRTRHLARIAAAAASGQRALLKPWYAAAHADGVSTDDLFEATLQVFLFAGFPRTIDAFEELHAALPDAPAPPREGGDESSESDQEQTDGDVARRGRAYFDAIYEQHAAAVLKKLTDLHPDFARLTLRGAYGRVLARPFLPRADRELMAVAMLAVMGLRAQLRAHVHGAERTGATADQIRGAVAAAEEAAGEELPDARELLNRVLP